MVSSLGLRSLLTARATTSCAAGAPPLQNSHQAGRSAVELVRLDVHSWRDPRVSFRSRSSLQAIAEHTKGDEAALLDSTKLSHEKRYPATPVALSSASGVMSVLRQA